MTFSRFRHATLALVAGLGLLATACDKDEVLSPADDAEVTAFLNLDADATIDAIAAPELSELDEARATFAASGEAEHRFHGDCFTVVFPVGVVFPDGSTVSVDSKEALKDSIRAYYAVNDRVRGERPQFAYPIQVQLADGSVETVESRRGLFELLRECRPDAVPCYSLVYPIELVLGDSLVSVADAQELRTAIGRYLRANPQGPRPQMVFPVQAEGPDGNLLELTSIDQLRRLRRACRQDRRDRIRDCFAFDFPITVEHRSGQTRTVETAAQLRRALSHANDRGRWRIVYPFTVTMADGSTVTIESAQAFRRLRASCD